MCQRHSWICDLNFAITQQDEDQTRCCDSLPIALQAAKPRKSVFWVAPQLGQFWSKTSSIQATRPCRSPLCKSSNRKPCRIQLQEMKDWGTRSPCYCRPLRGNQGKGWEQKGILRVCRCCTGASPARLLLERIERNRYFRVHFIFAISGIYLRMDKPRAEAYPSLCCLERKWWTDSYSVDTYTCSD